MKIGSAHSVLIVHVSGLLVLLISLAHLPGAFPALNSFDPLKRMTVSLGVWMALVAVPGFRSRTGSFLPWSAVALLSWMVGRSLIRETPLREMEVLFNWTLPLLGYLAGRVYSGDMDGSRLRVLGRWLLLVAGIQAVLMLLQYAGLDPLFRNTTSDFSYRPARMLGTIGYQNQAVDFLAVCLAGIWLCVRKRWLRGLALVVFGLVVVLSANRGGLLAFLLASLVVWPGSLWIRAYPSRDSLLRSILPTAGILICAGIGILLIPDARERFLDVSIRFDESVAVQSRVWMHRIAWTLWGEHPIIGTGAGEYAYRYLPVLADMLPTVKTHEILKSLVFAREAHFDLLQFGAEFGLIGIGLLVWCAREYIRTWRRAPVNERTVDALSPVIWVVIYMMTSSLFNFSWQSAAAGPVAGWLLGLLTPTLLTKEMSAIRAWPRLALPLLLATCATGFWSVSMYWNMNVPASLAEGKVESLVVRVPSWLHRPRSLVGAALAKEGEVDRAQRVLEQAESGYRDILVWNNRANLHMQKREWRQAIVVYRQWADTGIRHDEALRNLSTALESAGDPLNAAEVMAGKFTLWLPSTVAQIQRLSILYLQADEPRKSLHTLNKYYGIWREFSELDQATLWNSKGAAHLLLRQEEEARTAFETALRLNPNLFSAQKNLMSLDSNMRPSYSP